VAFHSETSQADRQAAVDAVGGEVIGGVTATGKRGFTWFVSMTTIALSDSVK
jgi:hypothetical protein